MKITFDKIDFLKFFNMVSVYKTYVEVADKVEIEPPSSAIDLLLYRLASLIIDNNWYETTIENGEVCLGIIQFMLGTAKTKLDAEISNAFNVQGHTLEINMEELWNYLVQNGIEV